MNSLRRIDILKYKYSRSLQKNPKDHKAWISYSQMVKRPLDTEVCVEKSTSKEGILRCRKILYHAESKFIKASENKEKAQIIQARGLLEFKHGNKIYGIALLERAVMISSICKPVLSWLIVREFLKIISTCELVALQYARDLLK